MLDYKRLFRSRRIRIFILDMLRFVPDKLMLKIQYRIKTGRKLNLKKPQRYTEKLQWYKLNYRNPILHTCVDKYKVREYVKSKGLEEILIPLYAKYDSVEQIDINALPNAFIMKTTNGGGGINIVVCPDKKQLNLDEVKQQLTSRKIKTRTGGREWAYYGLNAGIVVEKLLINKENPEAGINDFKIFCYNGIPRYVIVDVERYIGHKRNFYDTEWNRINITSDCPSAEYDIAKPDNLDEMLEIATKLSEGFPYVRVDLYNVEGKIYFGELTFYPWSGYVQFEPDEYDFKFGEKFFLNEK